MSKKNYWGLPGGPVVKTSSDAGTKHETEAVL